ncbi:MAG: hypothetical protein ACXW39_05910 [Nitrospira sp.]
MVAFLLTALLLTATPVCAADDRTLLDLDLGRVASDLLDKTKSDNLLHEWFDQALATVREYVEVEGNLPAQESRRSGEFRLKLFPQGKSHSQEHLSAEGSFSLSPEADQQEFTFRFKSSKPSQHSVPPSNEIL